MKNIKRRYVYAVLALPFVAFGVYAATLAPMDRGTFFAEFKHRTVVLFTGEPTEVPEGISPSGESAGDAASEGGGGDFDPAAIFARRDVDGDGKLTGDEISDRMRQNIEAFDADQDGSVTLEEFEPAMQQMLANRGGGGGGQEAGSAGPGSDGTSTSEGDDGSVAGSPSADGSEGLQHSETE